MIQLPPRPSSPRPHRALPSGTRVARASLAVVAALAVAGTATGCGIHLEASPGALPALTGTALVRDTSVRADAAAADQARALSAKATACSSCRESLDALAAASDARVQTLGGVWDPWNGATPEGATAPEPVADAPMDPQALATWLAATARRDLGEISGNTEVAGEDARTLGAVAVGRLASAQRLADAYGVDLSEGTAEVDSLQARLEVAMTAGGQGWRGWSFADEEVPDPQPSASPLPSDSADAQNSEDLAQAVRVWDCAAQALPRLQVVEGELDDASARADALLARAAAVLAMGVSDAREQRCALAGDVDLAGVDALVLGADLDLLASDSSTVRGIGAQMASQDVLKWEATGDAGLEAVPGVQVP
ncbi:MAG: hypothetical protein LKI58_02040 [Actinomyces sp.]|nr:hypothetical protein [Actinomyces sp.]MCI1641215.1 hypothetical protein [Actinomyces sp.]MCI1662524.1 hypothetical protein [Actinomyces sp.]MCI1786836.1 hypothetical protein [Actinomyces sp.]MCI1829022.1 hypothetical protein [Actinomyces sp.]